MPTASKWLDLVIGLDLHFEIVPPSPSPIPFPHPFVGVIFDPFGMVVDELIGAGMALLGAPPPPGPVLVGGVPATATGDEASMPTGHILLPPGVSWAPIPKVPIPGAPGRKAPLPDLPLPPTGDAMLLFGSQTVQWRGGRAVRMGDPALSCSDPVRLPTSFVVNSGPVNVLVGGPPALDWMSLATAAGFRLLRTKWASKLLHAGVEKFVPKRFNRARDFLHDAACFFTGHPVNVVNGSLVTTWEDVSLPGPVPLTFTRRYRSSFCSRDSVLGHGWAHNLDQQVWLENGRVVVLTEDGRELEFDTWDRHDRAMRKGDEIFDPVSRLTLRALGQFRWELESHDGLIRDFAPVPDESSEGRARGLARLHRIRNRAGDAITLRYEGGKLSEVIDCGGRRVVFEHDRDGRLSFIWLPAPNGEGMRQHAAFEYSSQGDLVVASDAVGKAVRFRYDRHNLVQETDRNGLRFYFDYEGVGDFARVIRTWGDGGLYDHVLTYDVQGRRTIVEDSLGHPTVYEWGAYGVVTAVTNARGETTRYEHDDRLRRTATIGAMGHAERVEYDERSNPVRMVAPGGAQTFIEYDEHDQPLALTTPRGGRWRWSYDALGRLTSEVDPLGAQTLYRYEGGRLVAVDDPAGARTQLAYDAAGNLERVTHPDGTTQHWEHDALGRAVAEIDAKGNRRVWAFDGAGRVVRVEEPDGNIRQLEYDGEGNVVRAVDRLRELRFTYQGLGKPTSRTIAGTTVRLEYDTEERVVAFMNEKGLRYCFERDAAGEVCAELGFDEVRKRYQRDAAGRVTKVLRPGVRKWSTYAYDDAGRVTEVTHSDGLTETFAYDEDGALVEASNPAGTVCFERDLLGRVVKEHWGQRWVESLYDHRGLRVGLASSLGAQQAFTRNAMGDVMSVAARTGAQRWEAAIERDGLGLEIDRQLPGGARSYWWRDRLGRPTQHWVGRDEQRSRGRRYSWGLDGQLGELVEEGQGSFAFEHDGRGFLVSTRQPSGRVDLRVPDEVGNLFRAADRSDREFGPTGELRKETTPEGVRTYRYDPEGNLVSREDPNGGTWSYAWDGAGRLAKVTRPDETEVCFEYDALGRRVRKVVGQEEVSWVWHGSTMLHELRSSGPSEAEVVTWVFDADHPAPAARLGASGVHSIVTDHLGTPLCALDEAGETAWQAAVDAWGRTSTAGEGTLCPWRFPGQYADEETGLYYNRFRYYDPGQGQYLSLDPIGLAGGLHLRAYVDDPSICLDPLGLSKSKSYSGENPGRRDPRLGGFIQGVGPDEIAALNRRFGGSTTLTGSIESVLASASRYEGFFKKSAAIVREIAGRHLFDNGNKRTANAVFDLLRSRNGVMSGASPDAVRKIINRVAQGEMADVAKIAQELRGF
ncbi:MAG: type II toxin-antitoxin system death-on-curing family toxin [Myxococcales bacterium]|nr:type II toxin-antitoxin system death-on-curing family toxin [Myxococcales bacterium]